MIDNDRFNVGRDLHIVADRSSIVVELMLAQYRAARIEETIAKTTFRVIWIGFCLHVVSMQGAAVGQPNGGGVGLYISLLSYFVISSAIFIVSGMESRKLSSQSVKFRSMLVSLDENLKDYYVYELEKNRDVYFGLFGFYLRIITRNESLIWFSAALVSLYLKFGSALFY